ncbi:DUF805 domain-containing protein [Asticcacaulis endophyticus]|uniref:DUF805 domain-containing protein n=1 Tax=Asticcacaulis endophyticus TaxID=1395890 RepID=A0A918QDQ9_9CAUL|nr:DUF805 domain-containing protein [Asticcacaulis endophyticus]GGZ43023.1 hypothetical protein GCM10011273_32200 [Asticcacaulis endophyticus]
MGSLSIWHLLIIVIVSLPAFLPLVIKRPAGNRFGPQPVGMSMGDAIGVCLKKYFDFNGRASRSEFWWFYLFNVVFNIALAVLARLTGLDGLISLSYGLIIPGLAVGARRLHDINRSGWWQLIGFGFGWFVLVYMLAQPPQNDIEEKAAVFD